MVIIFRFFYGHPVQSLASLNIFLDFLAIILIALYEKIKRSDEDFIEIGSAKDERMIKEMNEKGIDYSKNESVKEESKEEEAVWSLRYWSLEDGICFSWLVKEDIPFKGVIAIELLDLGLEDKRESSSAL
ncbi:hypothetical protein Tco_1131799 [Tanacetum coccineum]|uniref:Uncharacterized protein n=1 Tax=Tanacetum coccineum TaxID=301880 RepID=A0ABQ5JD36_9ASTR